eukprot:CAMPEP_0184693404 /NCGR_PEP_ID=MMETSP0313-20130426/1639_1 /TAXON_ID=2792 /ORGANISM="Porphyridium aerugineum, Strain SAG 1380-2" /LENGTH=507 /DNA_ID=CAMNT_0027151479 /DNA_START=61 /DNA_END=1584 /DNA_ORIENTATION=+
MSTRQDDSTNTGRTLLGLYRPVSTSISRPWLSLYYNYLPQDGACGKCSPKQIEVNRILVAVENELKRLESMEAAAFIQAQSLPEGNEVDHKEHRENKDGPKQHQPQQQHQQQGVGENDHGKPVDESIAALLRNRSKADLESLMYRLYSERRAHLECCACNNMDMPLALHHDSGESTDTVGKERFYFPSDVSNGRKQVIESERGSVIRPELHLSKPKASHTFADLSLELLHIIFKRLSPEDLARCSRVCSWWYVASRDPSHWRRACMQVFTKSSVNELMFDLCEYKGWKKMYMYRPHMRFDGVYAFRHQYVRATGQNSYASLVYYYRLLRFFEDSVVSSLTTAMKPEMAIKGLKREWDGNRDRVPAVGTYNFNESTRELGLEVPVMHPDYPNMKSGISSMTFELDQTHPGAHNRLWLRQHYTITDGDDHSVNIHPPDGVPFKFIPFHDFKEIFYDYYPDEQKDFLRKYQEQQRERANSKDAGSGQHHHHHHHFHAHMLESKRGSSSRK